MARRTKETETGSRTADLILEGERLVSRILEALEKNAVDNEGLAPQDRIPDERILEAHLQELQALDGAEEDHAARLAAVIRSMKEREESLTRARDRIEAARDRAREAVARCKGALYNLLVAREERGLEPRVELEHGAIRLQANSAPMVIGPDSDDDWLFAGFAKAGRLVRLTAEARAALEAGEVIPGFELHRGRHLRLP